MKIKKQYLAFFSATNNTKTLVKSIGERTGVTTYGEYDLTNGSEEKIIKFESSDLLVLGVPSYQGRVPAVALPAIHQLKGNNTPAIIVCSYGNREHEDTLVELQDLLESNNFRIVSAGAFVAQHSIFPKVAAHRPDAADTAQLGAFVHYTMKLLDELESIEKMPAISIKGNRPYRKIGNIPLHPTAINRCDACGICAHLCPTKAIPVNDPKSTDKDKCISCARCIGVCPQKARAFRGLLYNLVSFNFGRKHGSYKTNTTAYIKG